MNTEIEQAMNTYRSKTKLIEIAGSVSLAGLVLLAIASAPVEAATIRCRDTLLGQDCELPATLRPVERGWKTRCRDTLLGETCEDNRGGRIDCRNTLLGRDCETRGRRR